MEGSLVAYKIFTNGSVLNASEINDNLMNQAVMVFSNSAARSAAITAPVEGMLTWLQDEDRYENYTGTAWAPLFSPTGMDFLGSAFVAAASSISIDNVFTSSYKHYKIFGQATAAASGGGRWQVRMLRASDGALSTQSIIFGLGATAMGSNGSAFIGSTTTSAANVAISDAGSNSLELTIYNPRETSQTHISAMSVSPTYTSFGGALETAQADRGINIAFAGTNLTGTFRVYGLKDA
jgi:hypothetical protein